MYLSIAGRAGYAIPCRVSVSGAEKTVCIVCHGFGSSKDSPTAQMLFSALPQRGAGVIAFDFPNHGDSPVEGDALTITRCLDDLSAVEDYARTLAPAAEVVFFGSSFGAYLTLLYLGKNGLTDRRAFLRSAAIEMPSLFRHKTPAQEQSLRENGFVLLGEDYGYPRPLKITPAFLTELEANDVFAQYHGGNTLCMMHGSADQTASPAAAERFAARFAAQLTMLPGGDHRLSLPGMPEQVLTQALHFFGL